MHIAFAGKHATLSEKVIKRHHWHISFLYWADESQRQARTECIENAVHDIFAGRRSIDTPVDLPFEPTYVNMEIDAVAHGVDISEWPSDETLVDGKIIIPVTRSNFAQWVKVDAMSVASRTDGITAFLAKPFPILLLPVTNCKGKLSTEQFYCSAIEKSTPTRIIGYKHKQACVNMMLTKCTSHVPECAKTNTCE